MLGAWFGNTPLVLLAGALLGAAGLCRGWSALSLWRLDGTRRLDRSRAFPGEALTLSLGLDNRKFVPLAWAEVRVSLPDGLSLAEPAAEPPPLPSSDPDAPPRPAATLATGLGWYRRAERQVGLTCDRRGWYPLGRTIISSADPFGLFPRERLEPGPEAVVVYRRLRPLEAFGLSSRAPLGEAPDPSRLYDDPSRIRGVSDYVPGDPMRHLHWKASARLGRLQTKRFDPTTSLSVVIAIPCGAYARHDASSGSESAALANGAEGNGGQGIGAQGSGTAGGARGAPLFESALSVAASLAVALVADRHPIGLVADGAMADGSPAPWLPPAAGEDALIHLLTALAKLNRRTAPGPVVWDAAARLPSSATLVAVLPRLLPPDAARLAALRGAGRAVMALLHEPPETEPGFPWRLLGTGGERR